MSTRNIDLSIVFPVYNESSNILNFINRTVVCLINEKLSYEIICEVVLKPHLI